MNVVFEKTLQNGAQAGDTAGLVDLAFFEEIHGDFGTDLLRELKGNLELETEEAFEDLDRYAATGDCAGCAQKLHFLRGAAINLGLAYFAEHCQRLEAASYAGDVPSASARAALRSILIGSLESFDTRLSLLPS